MKIMVKNKQEYEQFKKEIELLIKVAGNQKEDASLYQEP